MQPGCDEIELLISKYVDGEATPEEREEVDAHIAGCDACACTLTSFMEMAALFNSSPLRQPDSQVRSGVFTEIARLKEAERRNEEIRSAVSQPRISPMLTPSQAPSRKPSWTSRLWSLGSPFALMGTAVAAVVVLMAILVRPDPGPAPIQAAHVTPEVPIPDGVSTIPADKVNKVIGSENAIPSPVVTRYPPHATASYVSATVRSTATFVRDRMLELAAPTAIMESGDVQKLSTWHTVSDPTYGYSISYPPNWWTQVAASTRYFFPWGPGGTRYAPCWIEMRVQANTNGYTAQSAMDSMFGGPCRDCTLQSNERGGLYLRRNFRESESYFDEVYVFDTSYIYLLRSRVPLQSSLANFQTRYTQSQDAFSRMSRSLALVPPNSRGPAGYSPILFLNGTDLWMVNSSGAGARPLTNGYVVLRYALAPDLRHVAFTANFSSPLESAEYLYIVDTAGEGPVTPQLIDSSLTIQDIAWSGDQDLLAIGKSADKTFGIFHIAVALRDASGKITSTSPQLLKSLGADMIGARGLSVSPDRQLITFLSPLGEAKGTDIYALRPDGTDLRQVVSHTDPRPPVTGAEDALTSENQAIKSYTWLDGRLEYGGYFLDMLLTCGPNISPTLYPGGFLYSAQGAVRGTILDPSMLHVEDADQVQIVHIAYSPHGKVALAGFYSLRDNRAEALAGLWTADVINGALDNLKSQPRPHDPNGIADLQWAADGQSLIYREVIPGDESDMVSRYEGERAFKLVRLNTSTGETTTLYDTTR